MARKLSPWELDNQWLLHESVQANVPAADLAHFVCTAVREALDVGPIEARYANDLSRRDNYPAMMTSLILYALQQGLRSSRTIARALETRVDFMALTGMQSTSFADIRQFRQDNEPALRELATQMIRLFVTLGLPLSGKGTDEDDGERTAVGFGKSEKEAEELAQAWFQGAAEADAQEDVLHGPDSRGDAVPDWLDSKARRARKLREAQTALEREAKAKAEAQRLLAMDDDEEEEPPPAAPAEPQDDFDFERERLRRLGPRAASRRGLVRPEPPADPRGAVREPTPARGPAQRPGSRVDPRSAARRPPSAGTGRRASADSRPDNFLTHRPESERILLMEVLVATALADGTLAAIEQRRIDALIRALRLDTRARQQVFAMMRDQRPAAPPTAEQLPDYDVRLHIFEQAAIMALADGVVHPAEKAYLRELAGTLDLDVEDAKAALVKANSVASR